MDARDLEALAERVTGLERTSRRLKRAGLVGLGGVAAALLMGGALPGDGWRTVEAERFLLRDAGGRIRAVLHTRADGSPLLEFRDVAGNRRASLGLLADAAHVSLSDAEGKGGATLRAQPNGRANLTLTDRNGTRRAVLLLADDGAPTLALSDRHRRTRIVLTTLGNGATGLSVSDAEGRVRAALDLEADGSPSLALYDENRRSRAILGHGELEGGQAGGVETRRASSLLLFDESGTVIWRAP